MKVPSKEGPRVLGQAAAPVIFGAAVDGTVTSATLLSTLRHPALVLQQAQTAVQGIFLPCVARLRALLGGQAFSVLFSRQQSPREFRQMIEPRQFEVFSGFLRFVGQFSGKWCNGCSKSQLFGFF